MYMWITCDYFVDNCLINRKSLVKFYKVNNMWIKERNKVKIFYTKCKTILYKSIKWYIYPYIIHIIHSTVDNVWTTWKYNIKRAIASEALFLYLLY